MKALVTPYYGANAAIYGCAIRGTKYDAVVLQAITGLKQPQGFNLDRYVRSHYANGGSCRYATKSRVDAHTYYFRFVCRNGATPTQQDVVAIRSGYFVAVNEGFRKVNLPRDVLMKVFALMRFS